MKNHSIALNKGYEMVITGMHKTNMNGGAFCKMGYTYQIFMIFASFETPLNTLQNGIVFSYNQISLRKRHNSYEKCATIDAKKCWFCASLQKNIY